MYREPIGDNLAKTILGGNYSESHNYFLLFKPSVTQLECVCKLTGAAEIIDLEDEAPSVEKLYPTTLALKISKPNLLHKAAEFIFILLCTGVLIWVFATARP